MVGLKPLKLSIVIFWQTLPAVCGVDKTYFSALLSPCIDFLSLWNTVPLTLFLQIHFQAADFFIPRKPTVKAGTLDIVSKRVHP